VLICRINIFITAKHSCKTFYFLEHITPLLLHVLVFLGLAYLFTKTPVFTDLVNNTLSLPDKIVIYLVFSGFCILGTFLSEQSFESESAIANTRAIGAVLGGLLGGPVVGFFVGFTGGIHRVWYMSSPTDPIHYIDIACAVATTFEGLLAGFVHYYLSHRGRMERLFSPRAVFLVTLIAVLGHMLIILLFGLFFNEISKTWVLIKEIAPPMLIANSAGVALIMYMIKDKNVLVTHSAAARRHGKLQRKPQASYLLDLTQNPASKLLKSYNRKPK